MVHIFILKAVNDSRASLLVLPDVPKAAVPSHLQAADWKYFLTTSSDDELIGGAGSALEELLKRDGYVLLRAPNSR